MTIESQLSPYLLGFAQGVEDRLRKNTEIRQFAVFDADKRRGYEAGLIAFDVAERIERQRLDQEQRQEEFIERSLKNGNTNYEPEAGEDIWTSIEVLVKFASRAGKCVTATHNGTSLEANPGEDAKTVSRRCAGKMWR